MWEGIPVYYVNPSGTSSVCAMCGSPITECAGRKVYCPHCSRLMNRYENAAMNIVNAGLRFSLKVGAGEAVKRNPQPGKVIPRADATQLPNQPKR